MINIKNLTKKFGETVALDDISFEVKRGEVLGFLGPNGAGKTTTLRIITGFISPTSGTVEIEGIDAVENSLQVRKKIGYLPETNPLYTEMLTSEYITFITDIRRINRAERKKKIEEVVRVCGISEVWSRPVGELSKGFRQRVGLAQALIHKPDILILDEPTSGLDPNQIVEIRSLIKKIGKERTVILSSHILPEVSATCDRVVIINKGKIVAKGTINELEKQARNKQTIYTKIKGPSALVVKQLTDLDGVTSAQEIDQEKEDIHGYRVEATGEHDLREHIFNIAVKNNWPLLELRGETVSLEDVFRELTTSED